MEFSTDDERFLLELLAGFADLGHARCRETLERYREKCKVQQYPSQYLYFIGLLINLAAAERSYMQLQFNATGTERSTGTLVARLSSSRREVSAKLAFANLSDEFRRLTSLSLTAAELSQRLADFCVLRSQLILVYAKLASLAGSDSSKSSPSGTNSFSPSTKVAILEGCCVQIASVADVLLPKVMHQAAMYRQCSYECSIVQNLIQSHLDLLRLRFLAPLRYLHDANELLTSWRADVQRQQEVSSPRRSSFFKLGGNSTSSAQGNTHLRLIDWLGEYYQLNLAKYGIYFHEVLNAYGLHELQPITSTQSTPKPSNTVVVGSSSGSTGNDSVLTSRISTLCRKHDAKCLAILANVVALGGSAADPDGYELPHAEARAERDTISGLDAFRIIFHVNFGENERKEQLPGVVMLMMEEEQKLAEAGNVVQVYDKVVSGHDGWVHCIDVEPGNEWVATGSSDRTIKIWDLATSKLKLTLTGHISSVKGLQISTRHPYLFSCGEDKTVKCWDLKQNKVIRHYHGHLNAVNTISVHPSIDIIATGGRDSTVRVWDIRTKTQILCFNGHTNTIGSVKLQAAEPQIISSSYDSTIRFWDIRNGQTMLTLTNHKKSVRALCFHPRLYMLGSASPDNIKQWKLPKGEFVQNCGGHNAIIEALACNTDGVFVSGAKNGSIHMWDWKSAHCFQKLQSIAQPGSIESEAGIFSLTFDQSGSRLLSAEADKTVKIYKENEEATEATHPLQWVPTIMRPTVLVCCTLLTLPSY